METAKNISTLKNQPTLQWILAGIPTTMAQETGKPTRKIERVSQKKNSNEASTGNFITLVAQRTSKALKSES